MKWILPVILLLIGFVFCMGCTSSPETIITNDMVSVIPAAETPIVIVTPSVVETITMPTVTPMPMRTIIPEPTLEEEPVPDWTEAPVIIPPANPDINGQNFTTYKGQDFMADYPEDWAVITQDYQLPDTTVYGIDVYKPTGRMVTFSSQDGNVSMIVWTYDFIAPKRHIYNPTIDAARKRVQDLFPNVSAETSVYNYHNQKNEQGIVTDRYDVLFTPDEEYYPYSYTEETWLTFNHYFIANFISKTGNLSDYNDLKYLMMKGIRTEGMQNKIWW